MKFSDRKFKIAIKIYDGKSVHSILRRREREESDEELETPAWVKGYMCITYDQLRDVYHYDSYSPHREVSEVSTNGFDLTGLFHPVLGEFECLWTRKEFEERADKFVEKYEAWLDEIDAIERAKDREDAQTEE